MMINLQWLCCRNPWFPKDLSTCGAVPAGAGGGDTLWAVLSEGHTPPGRARLQVDLSTGRQQRDVHPHTEILTHHA